MQTQLEDELVGTIEMLRERIRQLEEILSPALVLPIEWRLSPQETRVFCHLASRDECTKESIMLALYSGRLDEPQIKIVDVFICKMRKKLRPFGVQVRTLWGRGYALVDRERWVPAREAA